MGHVPKIEYVPRLKHDSKIGNVIINSELNDESGE